MALPIQFKEIAQLVQLGVAAESIGFATLTLESQKYICVRDTTQAENFVVVIDLDNTSRIVREKITADSAIMNPTKNILALKASPNNTKQALQVFDIGVREKLNDFLMGEVVEFWKWIDEDTLALVTATAVYHWPQQGGQGKPVKIFNRLDNLNGTQIINYRVDKAMLWSCLIGISKPGDRVLGAMQLYSVKHGQSQALEGHAAAFTQYKMGAESRTLFTFAVRNAGGSGKLFILEVGPDTKFEKKQTDIFFPPEADADFPVAMQTSEKFNVVYMITKFGYIHIFHIGTGKLIYMNRISAEPIFVTAPHITEGGIMGVNRRGQVLSVSIDKTNVIPFICNELKDYDLAIKFASDSNLDCSPELFTSQFNSLFAQQKFKEAAELAATSPNGILRTMQTIQRFQALPAIEGGHPPVIHYFTALLEQGKLNKVESVELIRPVLQQGRKNLLENWLKEDKVECTEELGDMIRPLDTMLALSVYYRAGVHNKVVSCLAQNSQYDKIPEYAQRANFTPNYVSILTDLVTANNRKGALDLASKLYKDATVTKPNVDELSRVVELFMSRGMLQETTSLLLDALKGDRAEEGPLQTKLLEINLIQAPQVAHAILGGDLFHHYNRSYVAQLAEKAGLFQRALEHYTDLNDRKRVLSNAPVIPQDYLIPWFGTIDVTDAIELLKDLMRNRANLPIVVAVASKHSESFGSDKLINLFESFNSFEGLYAYLMAIIDYSQDPDVHFKFIEAATKVGAMKDVERVCRESKIYNPEKVRDFLKQARIADQIPLVIVCDTWGFVDDLTHYLYKNNMLQYIEAYVQKINPLNTHLVVGALLDDDCNEDFIKKLILSVGSMCPVDELVSAVESRNRLKLLTPWLEARVQQGNVDPAVHNAIAKIYIDSNQDAEKFLITNSYYDSKIVGKYCENRDPHLAFIAYKRGLCDAELVDVTNRHNLFKDQARYLIHRQSEDLWNLVLNPENASRQSVLEQVIQTALPESENSDEVTSTVKALMKANMPNELIGLLHKLILEGSKFSENPHLQNLLILTAITSEPDRVMEYVHKLSHYDGEDIAEIAKNNNLFEEAFQVYEKFKVYHEAVAVLIHNLNQLDRAQDFAETVKDPKVWSLLAGGQLDAGMVKESIESYIKANDAAHFAKVINAVEIDGNLWEDLVKYLNMARRITKEPQIESELIYAFAKTKRMPELEEFIAGPTVAQIQLVGDRCFDEELFEAAKLLYNNISNFARLAITLLKLDEYGPAVEAARKANSTKTWKEVNKHLIEAKEFKLAQTCALYIIIHGDELDLLVKEYEIRGHFDEVISVLEAGLVLERAHVGMFTELAVLYSKYKSAKLSEFLKLYGGRINIPKVLKICSLNQQWKELAYLYELYEEWDNATLTMIAHSVDAWEHNKFLQVIGNVPNSEICYKAVRFYISQHPLLTNELLHKVTSKVDQEKVVKIAKELNVLPLIKGYLLAVQDSNLKGVNEAIHHLFIDEEDYEKLRSSIDEFSNFDAIGLAKTLRVHELLEFRRIAAYLYQKNKRWDDSVQLSKDDKLYKDAMKTASISGEHDVVDALLRFFIEKGLHECFAACLYTCYDLVKPDVAMELAWKAGITNLAMPYFIQVMREVNVRLEKIEAKEKAAEEKAKEAAASPNAGVILATPTGVESFVGSPMGMGMEGGIPVAYVDPNFYNPVVMGSAGYAVAPTHTGPVYHGTPPNSAAFPQQPGSFGL